MRPSQQLRQMRGAVIDEGNAILNAAHQAGRQLTADESRRHDAILARIEAFNAQIQAAEEQEGVSGEPASGPIFARDNFDAPAANRGDMAGLLTRDQSVADYLRQRGAGLVDGERVDLSLGKWLRGITLGRWDGADAERRASMLSGNDVQGGYLTPDSMGATLIDLVRAQAVVQRLGALTRPMEDGTMGWPVVTGDVTPEWHSELQDHTASAMTFGLKRMTAKTIVALARCSIELLEDGRPEDIESVVSRSMAQQIALKVDLSALRGSGAGELLGVKNAAGINTQAVSGALTFDDLSAAATTLATVDHRATGILLSPRTDGAMAIRKSGDGMYIDGVSLPSNIRSVPRLTSSQIPTNISGSQSEAYVADWSRLIIGVRTQLRFEVSREATVDSKSSFSSLAVALRCYMRLDSMLSHPAAFVYLSGITN